MILPSERDPSGALLVTARRAVAGKGNLGAREMSLDNATAKAYRSFTYGTVAAK
jgi:hypothetical protein